MSIFDVVFVLVLTMGQADNEPFGVRTFNSSGECVSALRELHTAFPSRGAGRLYLKCHEVEVFVGIEV